MIVNQTRTGSVITALIISLTFCASVSATQVSNQLTVSALHSDNLGPTWFNRDRISSEALVANYRRSYRTPSGPSWAWLFGASASLRTHSNYARDRASVSTFLGGEKKFGIGFYKPKVRFTWTGSQFIYEESALDTFNSRFSLSVARPLSEQLDIALELSSEWQIPQSGASPSPLSEQPAVLPADALDRRWSEIAVSSEYLVNSRWSLPLAVVYIRGDLENVSRLRPSGLAITNALTAAPSIGDDQFIYRYRGRVWLIRAAASRLLENGSTLTLGLDYASSNAGNDISYQSRAWSLTWSKNW